jgi:hypothetical protein
VFLCAIERRRRALYAFERMRRVGSAETFATLHGTWTAGVKNVAAGPCLSVGGRRSSNSSRRRDGRSGRAAFVSMMEAADLRDCHHGGAVASRRDRTRNWRVFVQRQMRAGPFVVRTIESHQRGTGHSLERLQKRDEIGLLLRAQADAEAAVIEVDHIGQRRRESVVKVRRARGKAPQNGSLEQ